MCKSKKEHQISTCTILYALLFIFFGVLFWQLIDKLTIFGVITIKISWVIWLICTVIIAGTTGTIIITRKKPIQKMRTSVWLATHMKKIILLCVVPLLCLISLTENVAESIDTLKDMISISWTIFTVIITTLFVWYVLIPEYLNEALKNQSSSKHSSSQQTIRVKTQYHEKVNIYYASADLVLITLISLLLSTVSVYISTKDVTLLNTNFVRCSFFLCVFNVLLIFKDTLIPIKKQRDKLLSQSHISKEEIEQEAQKAQNCENAKICINLIDNLSDMQESDKERIKTALRNQYESDVNEE